MYNFKNNFNSPQSKNSPKNKMKYKLKFNDISDSVQSSADDFEFSNYTNYNNDGSFQDNTFNYEMGDIKSEIDIVDHELPVIKQELETDSSSSSPKRKKKKHKESTVDYRLDNYLDQVLNNIDREDNGCEVKMKKSRTHSESDSQNGDHQNHKKDKKKRKKDKKLHESNDDNHSLETETDCSLSSEKSKKHKESGVFLNSETDNSALDNSLSKKKKKKKKQKDDLDGTDREHLEETNNHENTNGKLETHMNNGSLSASSPTKSEKKKRETSEDNCENNLENKLSEDNVDDLKKEKKKKKKKKKEKVDGNGIDTVEMNHDQNEIELETNSLNINEIDTDLHPMKAKKKKKKQKEKEQENVDNLSNSNIDQDPDDDIENQSKTPPTASNSIIETETQDDNNDDDDDDAMKNETSPIASDSNIEIETQTDNNDDDDDDDDKKKNNEISSHKNCFEMNSSDDDDSDVEYKKLRKSAYESPKENKINKSKKKINIISNKLLKKSPKKETTINNFRRKSLFAQRYEGYSSNDEHDAHLKPKVDHNTTLEDVLEQSNEIDDDNDLLEQFGNEINVVIPFKVPQLHKIESQLSDPLRNKRKEEIRSLGFKLKLGPFSKQEDELILTNWKDFCKTHDVPEDPRPFIKLNILKKIMSNEDRLNFGRYLARNLNDRILYSVYGRFCRLMERKTKRYGKFTREEDRIILDYLGHTDDKKPYVKLAKILNRDSGLIHKRVKKLKTNIETDSQIKWDKELLEDVVKNLLKVTGTKNVEIFKERTITFKEWEKISEIMKIPPLRLKYAWEHRIYRELFFEHAETSTAEIRTKLIQKLYDMKVTDFRTINWNEVAKDFDGLSAANLCKYFHNILQYHVPRNYHDQAEECLNYLQNQLLSSFQFAENKFKKIYLEI